MTTGGSAVLEPLWDEVFGTGHPNPPGVASYGIRPRREAVRDAREFARATLQRWNLLTLSDDVALVASELVTNALRHSVRTDGVEHCTAGFEEREPIRLSLIRQTSHVVCAVRDPSVAIPVEKAPDSTSESGRGLHLVNCFSDTWGWQLLDGTGKIVWALFSAPRDEL